MSETQGYKIGRPVTLVMPAEGADIARILFAEQLDAVAAVMDDPGADEYFTKNEWVAMGFQRLMLAQMIARMDREARNA